MPEPMGTNALTQLERVLLAFRTVRVHCEQLNNTARRSE